MREREGGGERQRGRKEGGGEREREIWFIMILKVLNLLLPYFSIIIQRYYFLSHNVH